MNDASKARIKAQQRIKYTRMLDDLIRRGLMGKLTRQQRAMKVVLERRIKELDEQANARRARNSQS